MTERRFYYWASLAPLVFPVLAYGVERVVAATGVTEHPVLGSIQMLAGAAARAGLLSSVPYLLYLAGTLRWARRQPTTSLRSALWCAPLVLAAGVTLVGAAALLLRGETAAVVPFAALYGVAAALVGYAYVVPIAGVRWAATRLGVVQAADASASVAELGGRVGA